MLACSPALAPLAAIAVQHHERLDGSGYPCGLSGGALSPEGRVLAAADFYRSRTEPRPHRPARPADLTGREIEVLQLLARGLSNREIAERLVISRKTAGHHVEHIYAKTGTTNRALASLFAASHGLITDPAAEPGADVTQGPAGSRSTRPASR